MNNEIIVLPLDLRYPYIGGLNRTWELFQEFSKVGYPQVDCEGYTLQWQQSRYDCWIPEGSFRKDNNIKSTSKTSLLEHSFRSISLMATRSWSVKILMIPQRPYRLGTNRTPCRIVKAIPILGTIWKSKVEAALLHCSEIKIDMGIYSKKMGPICYNMYGMLGDKIKTQWK